MPRLGRIAALLEEALGEALPVLRRLRGGVPPAEAFERCPAFRFEVAGGAPRVLPIEQPRTFDLDLLLGVERGLKRLLRNTERFLEGRPAHHVLLFGERGTGKSSAVRGLLPRYAGRGLRVVEVRKADLPVLPVLLGWLRPLPWRFLVFLDDLSFDEGEPGFRELKAALEGSLEAPPENVRVVATSNRRHLVPERPGDNRAARLDERGELHLGEALEEKLALADRFGLVIGFYGFDQETYLRIVLAYARRAGLALPEPELRERALRFALERSSRSGRTARQFVESLADRPLP